MGDGRAPPPHASMLKGDACKSYQLCLTTAPIADQAPPAPQVEVLELQNAVFCNCTRYLNSALATCSRLHTLVATGLWPLDLSVMSQAPRLECLAINICRGASLLPLAKLPQLRCACTLSAR